MPSSKHLRQIFEFAKSGDMPSFERVAKEIIQEEREKQQLPQMLDSYEGNSILICATNHEANLDSAIWRRFDEILKFDLPNETQIKQLLAIKLRSIRNNFFKQASIFKKFKGISHADIERILRRAIKTMVLDKREILELRDIEESLLKEKARKQESKRKR